MIAAFAGYVVVFGFVYALGRAASKVFPSAPPGLHDTRLDDLMDVADAVRETPPLHVDAAVVERALVEGYVAHARVAHRLAPPVAWVAEVVALEHTYRMPAADEMDD